MKSGRWMEGEGTERKGKGRGRKGKGRGRGGKGNEQCAKERDNETNCFRCLTVTPPTLKIKISLSLRTLINLSFEKKKILFSMTSF